MHGFPLRAVCRKTRPRAAAAAAGLLALLAWGCKPADQAGAPLGFGAAEIVAKVNEKPIYDEDVQTEAWARGAIREGETLPKETDAYFQILEDLIAVKLLAEEAESRRLDQAADVSRRIETARERVLAGALDEELANKALTPGAIERFYREQIATLNNGNEIRVRRIQVQSEESARAVRRRLEAGELFEAVAYDVSTERTTASEGGDLGFVYPENLPDSVRDALQKAKVNDLVGPLNVGESWHIYRLEGRRPFAPPTLEEMRPQLVQNMMFNERQSLLRKLLTAGQVERLVPTGADAALENVETPPAAPENEPASAEDVPAPEGAR